MTKKQKSAEVKVSPILDEKLNTKPGKYFLARVEGKNKRESAIAAGYADGQHTSMIEDTKTYQEIVRSYKDTLLSMVTLEQIAEAHADNILQSGMKVIDRGARNKAIEMAVSKIEPEKVLDDKDDRLVVVLRA